MLFHPIYKFSQFGLEFDREDMFAFEDGFRVHEAERPELSIHAGQLGGIRLFRVRSTGHSVSVQEPDHISIFVVRRGRMVVDTGSESFSASPGDTLVFAPNRRTTHIVRNSAGQFENQCVLIPAAKLSETSAPRAASLERLFAGTGVNRQAHGLRRLVSHLFEEGFQPSGSLDIDRAKAAASVLLAETIGALIDEDASAANGRSLPSQRDHDLVRRAEEIMRERYQEALSTARIAEDIGVSPRRVQLAFLNARGASPLDALRAMRLDIARDRLRTAMDGETVTGIAMECGFFHLGRFSRDYAEAFGETPSQSIRRPRKLA